MGGEVTCVKCGLMGEMVIERWNGRGTCIIMELSGILHIFIIYY